MNSGPHIIITGFMGSGKTTIARQLAHRLGREMLDLDHVIAQQLGRTAQEIIDEDGEESFRQIETRSLGMVLESRSASVVALGGGAWTLERNRNLIRQHRGITIWLDPGFDLCWERILMSRAERPLARDQAQARMLYLERIPLYALAPLRVEVSAGKSAENISMEIAQLLGLSDKQ